MPGPPAGQARVRRVCRPCSQTKGDTELTMLKENQAKLFTDRNWGGSQRFAKTDPRTRPPSGSTTTAKT